MKISATLNRYMARSYILNFILLLCALLAIIYLFDTVELIRRASKRDDVPLGLVLQMGILKLPEVGQVLFPFAILFSAMFTFWQFTRRHELVVFRAAGFSVWQFLSPVLMVALSLGLLQMMVINPVGSLFITKFEELERTYLSRQENQIAVFKEGLWLRQSTHPEDGSEREGYVILHAPRIEQPAWVLKNVSVLYFALGDRFYQRLDAERARLEAGRWVFENATVHRAGRKTDTLASYYLPTLLTVQDIEESFASPESMSFWFLPGYIKTLEQTGFDAKKLRVHYQSLLAQPLMFAAMVLLAATVSMRPPRLRGTMMLLAIGIFIGFVVFFLSSFLQALGASGQIPVILAAWSPALICFLLGLSVIMNLEDG